MNTQRVREVICGCLKRCEKLYTDVWIGARSYMQLFEGVREVLYRYLKRCENTPPEIGIVSFSACPEIH